MKLTATGVPTVVPHCLQVEIIGCHSFPRSSVGMPPPTFCVRIVPGRTDAERRRRHSHAERGNERMDVAAPNSPHEPRTSPPPDRQGVRFAAELRVGVLEEDRPVLAAHRVLAGADVVAERAVDEGVDLGHAPGVEPPRAEQAVDGFGRLEDLELPLGVGPGVLDGVGEEDGPGGDQGDQAVLIEGEPLGLVVEVLELGVEPVRVAGVDPLDRLADLGPARGRAAAAGLVRDHQRDPLVERGGDDRRLAHPRPADDGDPAAVDVLVGHEVIDGTRQPPRPGGDRPPVVRARLRLAGLEVVGEDPVDDALVVGGDVAAVVRRQRVPPADHVVDRPDVDLRAPAGVGRPVVLDARAQDRAATPPAARPSGRGPPCDCPGSSTPRKAGAGPFRAFGTTSSRWILGTSGGPRVIVTSFRVALPSRKPRSSRATANVSPSGRGGIWPYM